MTDAGTDAGLLAPGWAGTPAEAGLTDEAWLQAMLDVEAALARGQAELGLVPAWAAAAITGAARAERLDLVDLARRARLAANPVVALVPAFTAVVAAEHRPAAEFVHRGATSQDVLDSATMVLAGRALGQVAADLDRVAAALARHAGTHRDTVVAARTLAQHAVPTTFGLRAAGWLLPVVDALARVRDLAGRLPVQLGGAAGTLAAYREYAALDRPGCDADAVTLALVGAVADQLGLAVSVLPWHTARTPIADLGSVLALVTGVLGKFAVDVRTLSRTEIGELTEPAAPGRGASSAMPQKRNPVLATLVVSAAQQVPAHALVLTQCLLAEDERPAGAWHAEWQPLREALRLTAGAAGCAAELAEGLVVRPERMAATLGLTGAELVTERVGAVLAPTIGKAAAKELLAGVVAEGVPLPEALAGAGLAPESLVDLLDPARYTGLAGPLVDRALTEYVEFRAGARAENHPIDLG
ncbi:3-carboxy-cis,cis-muconate cycloisomerase [Actinophytocola xinjiangensis]|uniref:3-carboxy-cis,cis-muconate cycloisomerase n=1 Tax=Actinophytocola xinjiangensis TaxID=485602 RepID=A0A7Z0WRC4_9PSEU|nr:adenylosuccinate lyase family protein [Actinophytocola xinjiangensis]OLF13953.1 3-carboxy-cis,cis-muconate cycloisomerase [Actinophytocola xinjiangensis]